MYEIKLFGILQGVGFRPFVFNFASSKNLKGFVQNTSYGVRVVVDNKEVFLKILDENLPVNSIIDKVEVNKVVLEKIYDRFFIEKSAKCKGSSEINIPADLSVCDECARELFEEGNLREGYFFISCVNCGPRYSIMESLPYDRKNTSLKDFKLCNDCLKEFKDSFNKRFHAQTIACSKCGPELSFYKLTCSCSDSKYKKVESVNPVKGVVDLIKSAEIVAIKGVGGFHIVCNTSEDVVARLKRILKREHKPFALMGKDIGMVKDYVEVSDKEKKELESFRKPIVLLEKKDKNSFLHVSELSSLGFMLPYTGLHYLLFKYLDEPVVFTSSNMPGLPITLEREEQFVEFVLDYNRDIVNFVDDSVLKVVGENSLIVRKARGYSVERLKVPSNYMVSDFDLACFGSELKSVFCVKNGENIFVSNHIGNTYNLEVMDVFRKSLNNMLDLVDADLKSVVSDMNLNFNVTKFAKDFVKDKKECEFDLVQHHVAHGFGVAMEHNLKDFITIVCDGSGLGLDDCVWGGEVFHNDVRIGRLEYLNLIGGDVSNKEPIRFLVGILLSFLDEREVRDFFSIFDEKKIDVYVKQAKQEFNNVLTSSCGRVLDAFSVLLGFSDGVNYYEGRCSQILESNSSKDKVKMFIEPKIEFVDGEYVLLTTPLFKFVYDNLGKISSSDLGRFVHVYLAKGLHEIALRYKKEKSLDVPVCFSGGVSYNSIFTSFMVSNGVKIHDKVPCGDGGISYGQLAYVLWKKKFG